MRVKLIDFGLARRIPTDAPSHTHSRIAAISPGDDDGLGPDGLMTTPVGTPHFVAPEVLSSLPYGKEVDLFACGVIMYWLLSAHLPFNDADPNRLADSIKRVDYNFGHEVWSSVSPDTKDLIVGLMDRSPFSRLSAAVALGHPWFSHERRDSNIEVMPPVPGDEILVPKWKADPGLDTGTERAMSEDGFVSDGHRDEVSFQWSLTSPVSPALQGNGHKPFRETIYEC